jgi:hypothetical protein
VACGDACIECGAYGDTFGAECAACLTANCCDEERDVAERPAADQSVACYEASMDPSDRFRCESTTDRDSYDHFLPLFLCARDCTACAQGTNWACVGKYSELTPDAATAQYTVELDDFFKHPLKGIEVTACEGDGKGCAACEAGDAECPRGLTDDTGYASLTLPLGSLGWSGYIQFRDTLFQGNAGRIVDQFLVISDLAASRLDRLELIDPKSFQVAKDKIPEPVDMASDAVALIAAGDCTNTLASGIRFEISPSANVYYFDGILPNPDAKRTDHLSGAGVAIFHPDASGQLPAMVEYVMFRDDVPGAPQVGSGHVPLKRGFVSRTFGQPTPR